MPYAFSWYLDIVCQKKWSALVLDDYRAVFPLPYNRKLLGFHQLYQPILSQQGGISGQILVEETRRMLSAIPEKYRKVSLNLNSANFGVIGERSGISPKTNLLLPLRESYETILAGYGKSLRKRLRKAALQLQFQSGGDVAELIDVYREQLDTRLQWPTENYRIAATLFEEAISREKGFLARVNTADGKTEAIGFFLHSHQRIINLFGASTPAGRTSFAMHFLLDRVIHAHHDQAFYFDFEGSEIPGIADFFKSYGAREEVYGQYQKNDLPGWLNGLLSLR